MSITIHYAIIISIIHSLAHWLTFITKYYRKTPIFFFAKIPHNISSNCKIQCLWHPKIGIEWRFSKCVLNWHDDECISSHHSTTKALETFSRDRYNEYIIEMYLHRFSVRNHSGCFWFFIIWCDVTCQFFLPPPYAHWGKGNHSFPISLRAIIMKILTEKRGRVAESLLSSKSINCTQVNFWNFQSNSIDSAGAGFRIALTRIQSILLAVLGDWYA